MAASLQTHPRRYAQASEAEDAGEMCRALRVLCAAVTAGRLAELRRATVSAHWELVGGATSLTELLLQIEAEHPDVVVVHAGLGEGAVPAVRRLDQRIRIVGIGRVPGADEQTDSISHVREAILGLPRPGGPVRI
jgi:hypothetical protein